VADKTAFSPDGRLVAAASHEWDVGLWERESGRLLGVLPGPIGLIADSIGLAFDPSGRRFACSMGHEAALWDIVQHRLIGRWKLPEGLCDSIAFPRDGRLLLVRQENKSRQGGPFSTFPSNKFPRTVRLYDLLSATPTQPLTEIDDFDRQVHAIAIAGDGSLFAVDGVGTDHGKARRRFHVYQGPKGRLLRALPTTLELNAGGWIVFDPTSKVLVAALETAGLTFFDLPSMDYRGTSRAPVGGLSPDANRSLAKAQDPPPAIALYNLATQEPVLLIALDDSHLPRQNFAPDGCHAVCGRRDGTVSVLNLVEINRQLTKLNLGW
jgi:WD40 repeat protein